MPMLRSYKNVFNENSWTTKT